MSVARAFMYIPRMKTILTTLAVALCLHAMPECEASIYLNTTRVIFDGKNKEGSLVVVNDGDDVVIQSWVEPLDEKDNEALPFATTPPLARIQSKRQQMLRVLYEGAGMPVDRESAFWLNVQEIPRAVPGVNVLQFAVRQRIKVFYRPSELTGDPAKAPSTLLWRVSHVDGKGALTVENPSKYHVTLINMKLRIHDKSELVDDARMIAPESKLTLPLKSSIGGSEVPELTYQIINDYGARDGYRVMLNDEKANVPTEVGRYGMPTE
ncbi:pilus assembly protein [Burkholderia ubonensis]|nr:pilus assembly protein [Burkholderia ubonensis]